MKAKWGKRWLRMKIKKGIFGRANNVEIKLKTPMLTSILSIEGVLFLLWEVTIQGLSIEALFFIPLLNLAKNAL